MDLPDWLGTALVGAVIAAIGYVAKLAIEGVFDWRAARAARRARLVELLSLLLASKKAYEIQNELVQQLCDEITATHAQITGSSYDEILSRGYPLMDERQKLQHGLIRHYTSNCLYPLNLQTVDWLSKDNYFKGGGSKPEEKELSSKLQTLFAHLMLWRAKYEFWIPNKPEHAIVYMADEDRHGIGFPVGIEELIARSANLAWSPG